MLLSSPSNLFIAKEIDFLAKTIRESAAQMKGRKRDMRATQAHEIDRQSHFILAAMTKANSDILKQLKDDRHTQQRLAKI